MYTSLVGQTPATGTGEAATGLGEHVETEGDNGDGLHARNLSEVRPTGSKRRARVRQAGGGPRVWQPALPG